MLDAGNSSSYSGSGTTWSDISGNGRNFNINASAFKNTYTGNSQVKYMDFNGSYGCAKSASGSDVTISDSNGITLCCWTRIRDNTSNWRTLLRSLSSGGDHPIIAQQSAYKLGMYDNINGSGFNDSGFDVRNMPGYPSSSGPINNTWVQTNQEWVMMVWKWQNASPYYQFQLNNNPNILGSNTSANSRFKSGICSIGAHNDGNQTDVTLASQFWGDIAIFMLYDRLLTQAEINQNYETFAPRFNGGTNTTAGVSPRLVNVFPGIIPAPDTNSVGGVLYSDGSSGYWSYPGNSQGNVGSGFQYRSILTHGYLAGGYKGSCPWRSLNRTWHATDITLYCGEQLAYAANYIEGTFSDYNGYIHNAADTYATSNAGTQSYSLANGTMRTRGGGTYSPPGSGFGYPTDTGTSGVGGWNMSVSRIYLGCAVDQINQVGYITGGGSAVTEKFHFGSETMFTTTSGPGTGFASGSHGQTRGYFNIAGTKQYIDFGTNSWTSFSASLGSDGWCKILSSKLGYHYGGTGTNVSSGITKFSDSTGTDLLSMTKIRACGEENLQMGQNWGYMLGNYDGQQNNQTVKYNYLNDTLTQLGTSAQPKGHYGQSSAACSSAAASVCSTNASVGF